MGPADTVTKRRRMRGRLLAAIAMLVGAGVMVAGCGGSSRPGVANVSSSTASSGHSSLSSATGGSGSGGEPSGAGSSIGSTGYVQDELRFSRCMRANGVPNFPDPNADGGYTVRGSSSGDLDPSSLQYQRAQSRCRRYSAKTHIGAAQQAQILAQALEFARCMRAHGEPSFADPGQARASIGARTRIDKHSPIFRRAQSACAGDLPGRPGDPP